MKHKLCAALAVCAALTLTAQENILGKSPVGEFVVANGVAQSLDPSLMNTSAEHRVYMALFEGLVAYDAKTSKAVPGVAESWTFSADRSVITFKIRDGAVWSDGTPITAQTFVDSWLYLLAPNTQADYAFMISIIVKGAGACYAAGRNADMARLRNDVGIRAVDAHTFEVTLVGSLPFALDMMAHYAFSPLPMHVIKQHGAGWTKKAHFTGNGPFVLEEWAEDGTITVVPNGAYWNKANVHLSKITFLPVDYSLAAYNAFRDGAIDWNAVPPVSVSDSVQSDPDFHTATVAATHFYYINTQHPVLKDARIRKALSMSFDRQELIDTVLKGVQIPAFALAPPMGGYEPAAGTGFDIAEARRLLDQAGYPNGQGLPTLTIMYNTLDIHYRIADYLRKAWKKNLGIDVALQNLDWATFLDTRKSNRMQLGRAGWIADYPDAQTFLDLLITGSENNDGHYNSAEYDALMRQASSMPDGAERNAVMRNAEEIAITRDQAIIPIYYYVSHNLINLAAWDGWYTNYQDVHPYVGLKRK